MTRRSTERRVSRRRWVVSGIALLSAAAGLPVAAHASTVCPAGPPTCQYTTIQEAILNAASGDTITVTEPGTYAGNTVIPPIQGITIISNNPSARASFIIDGGGVGPVVKMGGGWVLEGFTITGGVAPFSGGGVTVGSLATIRNCIIRNNTAGDGGGGIYTAGGGDLTVENTLIHDNHARYAAGIFHLENVTLLDSDVFNNVATTDTGGIGVGGDLVIKNSQIFGNMANGGPGAGILKFFQNRPVKIENSHITGNVSSEEGGGLRITTGNVEIVGGSISGNSAGTTGGGVNISGGLVSFLGVDVSSNSSSSGGGGIHCSPGGGDSLQSFSGTLSGNTPDEIVGCGPVPGPGNNTTPTAADAEQSGTDADPVNTFTGELFNQFPRDIDLGGPMPLFFARYYASALVGANISGALGDNWRHNFEWTLTNIGDEIDIVNHRGRLIEFSRIGVAWAISGRTDIAFQLVEAPGQFTLLDPRNQRQYTFSTLGLLTSILDGRGNSHFLTYNGLNQLTDVSDGIGRTISFTYFLDGHLAPISDGIRTVTLAYTGNDLASVTDANGDVTTYAYDPGGLMTATIRPAGNSPFTQTWNGSGQVDSQTDSDGNTHSFAYAGLDTTLTDPLAQTRVHTHSATGEFSNRQDQAGQSFSMGSDSTGRRNSLTDRLGDTTTLTHHAPSGKLASVTHADGTTTSFTYTARLVGDVTDYDLTGITHADGTTESFVYDAAGNLTSHTDQAGNALTGTYNANGQPLTATNRAGGVTTHTYDADATRLTTTDPEGNTTNFNYDVLRRLSLITFADTSDVVLIYDNRDALLNTTDENLNTTTMTYDANGVLATVTDPLANTTTFTYDGNDRLLSRTDPLGGIVSTTYDPLGRVGTLTSENGNTTTLGYDVLGRLTSITDPLGKVRTHTYDAEAILTSSTDPLGNTTTFISDQMGRINQTTSPLGNVRSVSFDAMGRVITRTDPLGNTTTFSREARGLLSGITLPGGAISTTYTRNALGSITQVTDPGGNNWLRTYDVSGRITSRTDPLGNMRTITYDNRNRPSLITLPDALLSTLNLSYDPVGNLTSAGYSDGTTLNYAYDANDRLTSADGLALTRDANGRLTDSNGIAITRDASGRITRMTLAVGKTVTYSYDANDNLTQVTDWLGGISSFSYDAADRLTSMTRPNLVTTVNTYDDDNRLIGIDEGTISSITLTRDAKGQITGAIRLVPLPATAGGVADSAHTFDAASQVAGFTYDGLGRLTDDGANSFAWDLASRLTSYTVGGSAVNAAYDALGYRITRTTAAGTRSFVWNRALGLPSISIERQGGADLRYYVHTPGGGLLYSIDAATDTRRFYHFDEMGNTLSVTDEGGTVIGSYAYTPFGKLIAATGGLDNPSTWQGESGVMDEGNDLYYMRARYYDSATGRFISRDPIRSISPRELNPYQYALGNPLRFVDPSGRQGPLSEEEIARLIIRSIAYVAALEAAANDQVRAENAASSLGDNLAEPSDTVGFLDLDKFSLGIAEALGIVSIRPDSCANWYPEAAVPGGRYVVFDPDSIAYSLALGRARARACAQTNREANFLHLRDMVLEARKKMGKALDALETGDSRTTAQQDALRKSYNAAQAEVAQAEDRFERAGGSVLIDTELDPIVVLD